MTILLSIWVVSLVITLWWMLLLMYGLITQRPTAMSTLGLYHGLDTPSRVVFWICSFTGLLPELFIVAIIVTLITRVKGK